MNYYVVASADGYIAGPEGQFDFVGFDGDLATWIIDEYPETLPVHAREALGIADRGSRRHAPTHLSTRPRRRNQEPLPAPASDRLLNDGILVSGAVGSPAGAVDGGGETMTASPISRTL